MLISCPECSNDVSDKALACPHCGIPLKEPNIRAKRRSKRMRLPNGFGRITKINNQNLRNPYRAMVTVGIDDNGQPIGRLLKPQAYFRTYQEAYSALMEYHKHPILITSEKYTVEDVYKMWLDRKIKSGITNGTLMTYRVSWNYCDYIKGMDISSVRTAQIRTCIEEGYHVMSNGLKRYPSDIMKQKIKQLISMVFEYAIEYELVNVNYAKSIHLTPIQPVVKYQEPIHKAFSKEEMERLWENKDDPLVSILLIQCYSGWRPQEMCNLTVADVDLENWTFTGGMKTQSGINRIVPIHTLIRPLVEKHYCMAKENNFMALFVVDGTGKNRHMLRPLTYRMYQSAFTKSLQEVLASESVHRPHDGRKQFVTMAKEASVDEYAIKRIVGHKISDLTESIYTERSIDWLRNEIEKIVQY